MAVSKVQVEFLHCDQGMGSLIRIYSGDKLVNLVLIDLGSDLRYKGYAATAVNDVMKALVEMKDDGLDPNIALVIISHQDKDHWSLLNDLADQMYAKFKPFSSAKVKAIYGGGRLWLPSALIAVNSFRVKVKAPEQKPFGQNQSNFTDYNAKDPKVFAKFDDVKIRVLAVNVDCTRSGDSAKRNGTSAVMVLEFGGAHCIFPGDATAETIAFINKIFKGWKENPTRPCKALSVPHHGSLRTIADNYTSDKPKLSIAQEFTDAVRPQNIAASAGYYTSHKHPSRMVLKELGKHTAKVDIHGAVVYDHFSAELNKWMVIDTARGIYTTIRQLVMNKDGTPPDPMPWICTIDAKGKVTFELKKPLQERRASQRDRYPVVPASLREN